MYINTTNSEVDKLLACYSCLRTRHPIGYFSSPVSTGLRYYEWLAQSKHKIAQDEQPPVNLPDFQNNVFHPNKTDALDTLNVLIDNGDIIINPTSVGIISGWQSEDYANLWRKVIELNISYLIFNNGWNYSDGCVYEFYVAQVNHKKCYTTDKKEITLKEGLRSIKSALKHIKSLGFTSNMLVSVIKELEK